MRRIVKKDQVIVISGRYKGATGTVLKVFPKEDKVIVEGVNKVKKRVKASENSAGYVEKEAPIHVSNVALFDSKTGKPIKVSFSFNDKKIKIRVNRKTGEEIPAHR